LNREDGFKSLPLREKKISDVRSQTSGRRIRIRSLISEI